MTSHPPSLAEHFAGLRAALQPQTGELRPHAAALDLVLSNSAGFGGCNAALLLAQG